MCCRSDQPMHLSYFACPKCPRTKQLIQKYDCNLFVSITHQLKNLVWPNVSSHTGVPPKWKRPVTCMWGQPTCTKWPKTGVVRVIITGRIKKRIDCLLHSISNFLWTYLLKHVSAAGNAFSQAARLHLQMQSKHDAATNFIDAGNAFKKADPQGNDYLEVWLLILTCNAYFISYCASSDGPCTEHSAKASVLKSK